MGVKVLIGNPEDERCGENIILPKDPSLIKVVDIDLERIRKSYIRNAIQKYKEAQPQKKKNTEEDINFFIQETNSNEKFVKKVIREIM